MPNGVIAHEPSAKFDLDKLKAEAKAWPGLLGLDLVPEVTAGQSYTWDEMRWVWGKGYGRQESAGVPRRGRSTTASSATSCAAWRRPAAR